MAALTEQPSLLERLSKTLISPTSDVLRFMSWLSEARPYLGTTLSKRFSLKAADSSS